MQKDKPRSKKKLALAVTAVLMAAILLSATYAWLSVKDEVTNKLETINVTDGSVIIEETFTPPTDWQPGQKITKEVAVSNIGDLPVLVRVHFEEAMKLLGARNGYTTPTDAAMDTPQYINMDYYLGNNEYKTPSAQSLTLVDENGAPYTLPSKVNLLVKKVTESTSNRDSYSFVLYYEISTGKYQKMSADFAVSGSKVTIDTTTMKYYGFPVGTTATAKWPTDKPTVIIRPVTDTGDKIVLEYSGDLVTGAITDNKWFYNEDDGYFYYMKVLEPKQVSPNLLTSLSLKPDAGDSYLGMKFELTVKMEAVQVLEEAVKGSGNGGWGLSSGAVYTKLADMITKYNTTP